VLINRNGTPSVGLLGYVGVAVFFHALMFEAVFSKAKALLYVTWGLITVGCVLLFLFVSSVVTSGMIAGFLVVYAVALQAFLRNRFASSDSAKDENRGKLTEDA
jgi:hypothetical protein